MSVEEGNFLLHDFGAVQSYFPLAGYDVDTYSG